MNLNTDPATEYAVFLPESERYVTDANGRVVAFPTEAMAKQAGRAAKEPWEVYTRCNFAATPWKVVSRVEPYATDWA